MKPCELKYLLKILALDLFNLPAVVWAFDLFSIVWVTTENSLPLILHDWMVVVFDFVKIVYIIFLIGLNIYGGWRLWWSSVYGWFKNKRKGNGLDNKEL